MGNDRTDRLGGESNHHKWLASRKIRSVEDLEIDALPIRAQSQGHDTIDRLEERDGEDHEITSENITKGSYITYIIEILFLIFFKILLVPFSRNGHSTTTLL